MKNIRVQQALQWKKYRRLKNVIEFYSSIGKGIICDVLRDLLPFVQFEKREKHPWRSVTFSKVAGF